MSRSFREMIEIKSECKPQVVETNDFIQDDICVRRSLRERKVHPVNRYHCYSLLSNKMIN